MSELNVYHHELRPDEYDEFYLKYEADKVITELKMKLASAQMVLRLNKPEALFSDLKIMGILKHQIYVVARREHHQKYKRCLAMVDALTWEHNYLVDFVSDDFPNVRFKRRHRIKWVNRWLALAEEPTWAKFLQLIHKEAK